MDAMNLLRDLLAESGDKDNPGPEELRAILRATRSIAVVGISRNPAKAAHQVPAYMAANGFEIIPVNPFVDSVLGKDAKASLPEVTAPVDMVLLFRPSPEASQVAEAALARQEQQLHDEISAHAYSMRSHEEIA